MESLKELYRIGTGPSSSHTMGPERAAARFKEKNLYADRFIATLIQIKRECEEAAASGEADNVVVNAPHTAAEICGEWSHPYTREKAVFPLDFIRESKFFPYVSKIDNGYGDRNLVCRCTE